MQKLTTIREIFRNRDAYIGQTVEIGGWVRNIRDSKTFGFLVVNDGTYFEPLHYGGTRQRSPSLCDGSTDR